MNGRDDTILPGLREFRRLLDFVKYLIERFCNIVSGVGEKTGRDAIEAATLSGIQTAENFRNSGLTAVEVAESAARDGVGKVALITAGRSDEYALKIVCEKFGFVFVRDGLSGVQFQS